MQDRSPKQDSGRRIIEADDHRRSGGGDAGHRLEHGIGKIKLQLAEHEGQRAEKADDDPDQRGQEEGLTAGDLAEAGRPVHQEKVDAGKEGHAACREKDLPVRIADCEVGDHRRRHEQSENDQENADHQEDRAKVQRCRFARCGSRGFDDMR